mgnify:CR=1 FL=1
MNKVELDDRKYEELIKDQERLDILKNLILECCKLDYSEEELRIWDSDDLIKFFKILFPESYADTLVRLQMKKKFKEGDE